MLQITTVSRGQKEKEMLSTLEKSRRFTRPYTRAQAFQDGVLINLSGDFPECQEHYSWYRVACTIGVWEAIAQGVNNPRCKEDFKSVVLDLLNLSASVVQRIGSEEHLFQFTMTGNGEDKLYMLRAICGPGDFCEPAVTIMLEDE